MVDELAARLGKSVKPVAQDDTIRFMADHKRPVLVTLASRDWHVAGKVNGHALVVGNPFIVRVFGEYRHIVFETFDGNYPTGMVGYIDARELDKLMQAGLAIVDTSRH